MLNEQNEAPLLAAIQRTLKVVLHMQKTHTELGDPLNFTTIKDKLQIEIIIKHLLNEEDLTLSRLRLYMRNFSHIYQKRFYQLFNLLDEVLDNREEGIILINRITKCYLKLYKSETT